jgi:hypothetical protein
MGGSLPPQGGVFDERYGVIPADARAGCEQPAQPSDHRQILASAVQSPSAPSALLIARLRANLAGLRVALESCAA